MENIKLSAKNVPIQGQGFNVLCYFNTLGDTQKKELSMR